MAEIIDGREVPPAVEAEGRAAIAAWAAKSSPAEAPERTPKAAPAAPAPKEG